MESQEGCGGSGGNGAEENDFVKAPPYGLKRRLIAGRIAFESQNKAVFLEEEAAEEGI